MAKSATVANRHRIWIFGQSYDFHIVTTDRLQPSGYPLGAADYRTTGGAGSTVPEQRQKRQVVLHCTAGNSSGEGTIGWWNNPASGVSSAHFVVERTSVAQVPRPPAGGGAPADNQDTGLVDVVLVMKEDTVTYHAGVVNACSIGIEHANVGWGWYATNTTNEPSLAGKHSPVNTCPSPINIGTVAAPRLRCNCARPQDENRYIHLATAFAGHRDYQAYEEEQYMVMILLLRHLCIAHRIPRQFLGSNRQEDLRHWFHHGSAAQRRANKAAIYHFRGIFGHRNVHESKPCPAIIHKNRLYRGIIDEWWMPVELNGQIRNYYSGPFSPPTWAAGSATGNAYFRYTSAGRIEGTTYRNANLDALLEARSYFNLDHVTRYYSRVETRNGGIFPIGVNRSWHGGVHLPVRASNPCVYAAASGTIVAARVSSNSTTDGHARFGSQCFVLIRHAVYVQTEVDPNGTGPNDRRINYGADPIYVFTLYMHLRAAQEGAATTEALNPPWFNIWRRDNPIPSVGMDGEKGVVFAPNIKVSVGDIIGFVDANSYRGQRMIHFEVLTHRNTELTMEPWNNARKRGVDTNSDMICDAATLNSFVTDVYGDGIDRIDILRAAPQLRDAKALHKSEWSVTSESQIESLIPHRDRRRVLWPHISRFSWVAEAIAANPDLRTQLGDANGIFWHYHPVRFMQFVNQLILGENRETPESEYHDTNVEISEDYFFVRFIRWNAGTNSYDTIGADNAEIRANDLSSVRSTIPSPYRFRFTRENIACNQPGAHNPPQSPPQTTRFSVALLEILQRIRHHYNRGINITLSYVCSAHTGDNSICVMNSADAMRKHSQGVAVDFRPDRLNNMNCRNLWNSVVAIVDAFNRLMGPAYIPGTPTQANLPRGYSSFRYQTHPATVQTKLTATPQQNLTAAEANAFRIHLELVEARVPVTRPDTTALPVRLRVTLQSIEVIEDHDLGSAEWEVQCSINGTLRHSLSRTGINDGDLIRLSGWSTDVSIDPRTGGNLQISVSGIETDEHWHDTLGTINITYNQNSSPSWGIGTHREASSNRSFWLTFRIDSLNVEY